MTGHGDDAEPEFQYPAIHVRRRIDAGDHYITEAVSSPVCDFCFDERVTWDYPCKTFYIDSVDFGSENGWAVCHTCSMHIESQDHVALIERVQRSWNELSGGSTNQAKHKGHMDLAARLIVLAFVAHRTGPRVPFG